MLNYEKLDVYQCSIKFLAISATILDELERGSASIKDQLRRASVSIPLNIAESSGKTSGNDRARFLAIARGSAMECGACLDCIRVLYPVCEKQLNEAKILITRIVEMLSKMCRKST